MNWLDAALLFLLFFAAVVGYRRGLVRQLFDLAGFFAAYYFALRYAAYITDWLIRYVPFMESLPDYLTDPGPFGFNLGDILLRLISFFLIFMLIRLVLGLVGSFAHQVFSLPLLCTFNALGGSLLGLTKGVLLALILVAVLQLLSTPFWINTLEQSRLAAYVQAVWPVVYRQMIFFLFDRQAV